MRIEILEVEISNFIHYGMSNEKIELKQGITGILGKNGTGKSSILDAILYCLFGFDSKDLRNSALKPHGYVSVLIKSDNELICFKKSKNDKGKIIRSARINDAAEQLLNAVDFAKSVHDKIGLDHKAFINSSFILQDHLQDISNAIPSDRLTIFKKIFSLTIYDKFCEKAKGERALIESKLVALTKELDLRKARLREIEDSGLSSNVQELKEELAIVKKRISELETTMKSKKDRVTILDDDVSKLNNKRGQEISLESEQRNIHKQITENEALIAKQAMIEASLLKIQNERQQHESAENIDNKRLSLLKEREEFQVIKNDVARLDRQESQLINDCEMRKNKSNVEISRLENRIAEARDTGLLPFDQGIEATQKFGQTLGRKGRIIEELNGNILQNEYIKDAKAEIAKIDAELPILTGGFIKFKPESASLSIFIENADRVKGDLEKELKTHEDRVKALRLERDQLKNKMPNHDEKVLEFITAEMGIVKKLDQDITAIKEQKALLDHAKKREDELQKRMNDISLTLTGIENETLALESSELQRNAILKEIENAELEFRKLNGRNNEIEVLIKASLAADKKALILLIQQVEKHVTEAEREAMILDRLADAFSQKGIVNFCLSKILPYVSHHATIHANVLSDSRITTIKLIKAAKGIDLELSVDGEPRKIQELSGGEKVIVGLSLRFAICQVLAAMTQVQVSTVFLDEGIASLDQGDEDSNLIRFMNRLKLLNQYFSNIAIISHLPLLQDFFTNRYHVYRDKQGKSRISLQQV